MVIVIDDVGVICYNHPVVDGKLRGHVPPKRAVAPTRGGRLVRGALHVLLWVADGLYTGLGNREVVGVLRRTGADIDKSSGTDDAVEG